MNTRLKEWTSVFSKFDRLEADVKAFNRTAAAITGDMGIPVDDLYAFVSSGNPDEMLLQDGVHFTDEAYERIGTAVADCIRGLWM